ncbi:hypothetical protein RW095_01625 [Paraburkholderia kirstenboschensis]|uniref:Uncharacterized protein n=1 Tax=Paraburkholderia kirstenboschensis TaxID=1245436 RepID=A0ABZ0EDC5_9BURK|nr:hypothetical protein [Paraburkholderia kirstenboschensis]WOD14237.1 hypothetical protein RW095_01625 [Paraburkholderia kirstenboschensis]
MSARWIAGGDDYRIRRINQTSLAVRESAFVKELQKQVMHLALLDERKKANSTLYGRRRTRHMNGAKGENRIICG